MLCRDWTVPTGVTSVTIDAYGSSGGDGAGTTAGTEELGGRATATIGVTPGESLQVVVGSIGGAGAGSFGGPGGCTYSGTTAVTLRSLSATRSSSGVLVRWRVASAIDALGCNIYRDLSRRLVLEIGRASYAFLDRKAPRGKVVRYWIQVVGLDGSRRWHGPARVARP